MRDRNTRQAYSPVGAHMSVATTASDVATLTSPAGADGFLLQAITANLRFTLDGSAPTSAVGFQIPVGYMPVFVPLTENAVLKLIGEGAGKVEYQAVKLV